MRLFIWVPGPMGGDMGGGGGGTWKGLAGSLAPTCLWPPGYILGGAGGGPPRRGRTLVSSIKVRGSLVSWPGAQTKTSAVDGPR